MTTLHAVDAFVEALHELPRLPCVFNPWRDVDTERDAVYIAPEIRSEQLRRYLQQRLGSARVVLVAEAPSASGAKYTGIAMTSERILLGNHAQVPAASALVGGAVQTSRKEEHPRGCNELTATLVWTLMAACGFAPTEFVLWNAFPCHPHKPGLPLKNRAPTAEELIAAAHVLPQFLALFPQALVIAVGDIAKKTLLSMGHDLPHVRHPSMGGAVKFRSQLADILRTEAPPRSPAG